MPVLKLFVIATALLSALVIDHRRRPAVESPDSVYVRRSHLAQEHYRTLAERLEAYYESLLARLREEAPDLVPLLLAGPKALQRGYQILPRIVGGEPEVERRAGSISYSWRWTEQLIDGGLWEIAGLEKKLRMAAASRPADRRPAYEKLARGFARLRERQENIDAHLQYNRLWQAAIAADRPRHDRETLLHNAVVERQAILDALKRRHSAALEEPPGRMQPTVRSALARSALLEREAILRGDIHAAIEDIGAAAFIRLERTGSRLKIFHVPFYTDIGDVDFVRSVKEIIERAWRLRDGDDEFRVELSISFIPAGRLYENRSSPTKGDPVDVHQHLALFPPDGAILTTGAGTTHVYGRAIILGPHDMSPGVLAHEFGHILGFRDAYFRGYKDLGQNGFQVMEIVADPDDIMGFPRTGRILRRHFEGTRPAAY